MVGSLRFICDGRKVPRQTRALHHLPPRGSIHDTKHATRKHSSRMRTARLLTVGCVCVCAQQQHTDSIILVFSKYLRFRLSLSLSLNSRITISQIWINSVT